LKHHIIEIRDNSAVPGGCSAVVVHKQLSFLPHEAAIVSGLGWQAKQTVVPRPMTFAPRGEFQDIVRKRVFVCRTAFQEAHL